MSAFLYAYAKAARGAEGCIGVVKEMAVDSIGHHLRMHPARISSVLPQAS